jgi:hypothetical protein
VARLGLRHAEGSAGGRGLNGERRALQIAIALAGIVPVTAGLDGILQGAGMTGPASLDGAPALALDSHVRYLSGLLLALGVTFWASLPTIERQGARVRLLTLLVVVGGLGRLYGIALHGNPGGPMLFGLVMELVVTPALCLWQARVSAHARVSPRTPS